MRHSYPLIERGGILLKPDLADPREKDGIFNPAVAGDYLLYRAVAEGNYSRIMAAKLYVERLGDDRIRMWAEKTGKVVLEPEADYELKDKNRGGVEDPRVTKIGSDYYMFYTGYGWPKGFPEIEAVEGVIGQVPVIAAAKSSDGLNWTRLGRLTFEPFRHHGIESDFNQLPNKDAVLLSEKVNGKFVMYHRPMFSKTQAALYGLPWRAIWCSEADNITGPWTNHRIVLQPVFPWEGEGVGAGVPPVKLSDAWVNVYHGYVRHGHDRNYGAGIFITNLTEPDRVIYRSECALLLPNEDSERVGFTPDVVFPTAVWPMQDDDDSLVLFWGGADSLIMWGQLHLPASVRN